MDAQFHRIAAIVKCLSQQNTSLNAGDIKEEVINDIDKKTMTVSEIIEYIEKEGLNKVDKRTIQRDILKLQDISFLLVEDMGIPDDDNDDKFQSNLREIYLQSKVESGVESLIRSIALLPHEAYAIKFIEKYLKHWVPGINEIRIFNHAEAIINISADKNNSEIRSIFSKLAIHREQLSYDFESKLQEVTGDTKLSLFKDIFLVIQKSVYTQHSLKLGYKDNSFLVVNPIGLVLKEGGVYLVAFDNADSRVYYVFDVLEVYFVEILKEKFELDDDFHFQQFLDEGNIDFSKLASAQFVKDKIKIELLFLDSPFIHNIFNAGLKISSDQVFVKIGSRYKLSATVHDTEKLFCWIINFGYLVEVISPEPLRNKVKEHTSYLCKMYGV